MFLFGKRKNDKDKDKPLLNNSSEHAEGPYCHVCGKLANPVYSNVKPPFYCDEHALDYSQQVPKESKSQQQIQDNAAVENNIAQLQEMFKDLNEEAIRICLRDCDNNLERAIDTLLNLQALLTKRSSPSPNHQQNGQPQPPRTTTSTVGVSNATTSTVEPTIDLIKAIQQNNAHAIHQFFASKKPIPMNTLNTALLTSIEHANPSAMSLILDHGANPNGEPNSVYTPLLLALETKQLECAKLLITKYKADPNLSNGTSYPLLLSIRYSYTDITELLLKSGAKVNVIEKDTNKNPLHVAIEVQDYDVSAKLLEQDVQLLAAKDSVRSETPLLASIRTCKKTRDVMLLSLLLEKAKTVGCLDSQDINGDTALHVAVERSLLPQASSTLVSLVLGNGPNPKLKNKNNKTPLDIVKNTDKQKVIQLLREYIMKWNEDHNIMDDDDPTLVKFKKLPYDAKKEQIDPDYEAVKKFKEYTENLLSTDTVASQYEEIEAATANANLISDFTSALLPHNLFKNRYRNILPFEKTRVKLTPIEGILGSDFISANWISGETAGTERAYIATQGPLQHTVEDFWRMVWEFNVSVIVMLSNLVENGREKVFQYFPEPNASYDLTFYSISLRTSSKEDQLISRKFDIMERKTGKTRSVTHLQYVAWPDHGLPANTSGFLRILEITEAENTNNAPIVVHCSAGIGRTGTFCIAHAILLKLRMLLWKSFPTSLDIKNSVLRMRENRAGMIQTREQYEFCVMLLKDEASSILDKLDYKNLKVFHKEKTVPAAIEFLKKKPEGSFIIHPSNDQMSLVASISKGNTAIHLTLTVNEHGFQIDKKGKLYPSLLSLIEGNQALFKFPLYS